MLLQKPGFVFLYKYTFSNKHLSLSMLNCVNCDVFMLKCRLLQIVFPPVCATFNKLKTRLVKTEQTLV